MTVQIGMVGNGVANEIWYDPPPSLSTVKLKLSGCFPVILPFMSTQPATTFELSNSPTSERVCSQHGHKNRYKHCQIRASPLRKIAALQAVATRAKATIFNISCI